MMVTRVVRKNSGGRESGRGEEKILGRSKMMPRLHLNRMMGHGVKLGKMLKLIGEIESQGTRDEQKKNSKEVKLLEETMDNLRNEVKRLGRRMKN